MADYRYEYGQRWNAQLPRNEIRFLVQRMHCQTLDVEVQEEIRLRCVKSGIPERMHKACMRYALCVHSAQRKLYSRVLRGTLGLLLALATAATQTGTQTPVCYTFDGAAYCIGIPAADTQACYQTGKRIYCDERT